MSFQYIIGSKNIGGCKEIAVKKETKTQDAEAREIRQEIKMTVEERQKIAKKIKQEYFGKKLPDVRDY